MRKKIILSLMVIGLVSALVGGATFAAFTSTATNDDNNFKAGTLTVTAGNQVYSEEIDLTNLKPGDTIDGSFTVSNGGTLPLDYTVTTNAAGDLFDGDFNNDNTVDDSNYATVTITSGQSGSLSNGGSATVNYTITFPQDAGDGFQGKTGTLSFTVDASQQVN